MAGKEPILRENIGELTDKQPENLGILNFLTTNIRNLTDLLLNSKKPISNVPKTYVNYNQVIIASTESNYRIKKPRNFKRFENGDNGLTVGNIKITSKSSSRFDEFVDINSKGMRISSNDGNKTVGDRVTGIFTIGVEDFKLEGKITRKQEKNGKFEYLINFETNPSDSNNTEILKNQNKMLLKLKNFLLKIGH